MQSLRLAEERLDGFLNALRDEGELYAPVAREVQSGKAQGTEVFALERIEDPRRARPDALRTILPFKKLLLPPRVTVTRGDARGWRDGDDEPIAPMIFYGAHACDVHALKILDLLFLSDFPDPSYRQRREKLTVIGYGCARREVLLPVGTATVDDGFDLFFTPLRGRYLVTIGSARGDDSCAATRSVSAGLARRHPGSTWRGSRRTASFALARHARSPLRARAQEGRSGLGGTGTEVPLLRLLLDRLPHLHLLQPVGPDAERRLLGASALLGCLPLP
ncbi:MAG: hypothetical protein U0527_05885 [Candidatus Eisenbacteria bacterium]